MNERNDGPPSDEPDRAESLIATVGRKEQRKQRARRERKGALATGLGLFGLVGWSVTIPTLLGIALGVWIDGRFSSRFSWTLMLLVAGLMVGCLNAWYWLNQERNRD